MFPGFCATYPYTVTHRSRLFPALGDYTFSERKGQGKRRRSGAKRREGEAPILSRDNTYDPAELHDKMECPAFQTSTVVSLLLKTGVERHHCAFMSPFISHRGLPCPAGATVSFPVCCGLCVNPGMHDAHHQLLVPIAAPVPACIHTHIDRMPTCSWLMLVYELHNFFVLYLVRAPAADSFS